MRVFENKYIINGKTYAQKPLVLGQVMPLVKLLEGKVITDISPFSLITVLGESLPRCLAIILIPEGASARDRDLDALEIDFADNMDVNTAMQVVTDFFLCNPLSSLSAKFRTMVTGIWEEVAKKKPDQSSS